MPYERPTPRVRRYDAGRRTASGGEQVVVEVTRPIADPGRRAGVSDHDWKARSTGSIVPNVSAAPAASRAGRPVPDPPASSVPGRRLARRLRIPPWSSPSLSPYPATDRDRIEYLRFDLPPGTTRLEVDLVGNAVLTVDGRDRCRLRASGRRRSGRRRGRAAHLDDHPGLRGGRGAHRTDPGNRRPRPDRPGRLGGPRPVRIQRRSPLPPAARPPGRRIELDLGRVRGTAEVLMDGVSVGGPVLLAVHLRPHRRRGRRTHPRHRSLRHRSPPPRRHQPNPLHLPRPKHLRPLRPSPRRGIGT